MTENVIGSKSKKVQRTLGQMEKINHITNMTIQLSRWTITVKEVPPGTTACNQCNNNFTPKTFETRAPYHAILTRITNQILHSVTGVSCIITRFRSCENNQQDNETFLSLNRNTGKYREIRILDNLYTGKMEKFQKISHKVWKFVSKKSVNYGNEIVEKILENIKKYTGKNEKFVSWKSQNPVLLL